MEALAQAGRFGADEFLEGSTGFSKAQPRFQEIADGRALHRYHGLAWIDHPIVCGGMAWLADAKYVRRGPAGVSVS